VYRNRIIRWTTGARLLPRACICLFATTSRLTLQPSSSTGNTSTTSFKIICVAYFIQVEEIRFIHFIQYGRGVKILLRFGTAIFIRHILPLNPYGTFQNSRQCTVKNMWPTDRRGWHSAPRRSRCIIHGNFTAFGSMVHDTSICHSLVKETNNMLKYKMNNFSFTNHKYIFTKV
jgi:hypothetical protein